MNLRLTWIVTLLLGAACDSGAEPVPPPASALESAEDRACREAYWTCHAGIRTECPVLDTWSALSEHPTEAELETRDRAIEHNLGCNDLIQVSCLEPYYACRGEDE